jgi:peptidyl-prolyl cis-trans isomerase C
MKPMTQALAASAFALALAAPGAAPAADGATVVARVGDTEITLAHVVGLMARLPEQYRQLPDQVLFDGILEQIVEQTAVAQQIAEPLPLRVRIDLENSRREVLVNDALTRVARDALTEEALRALYDERYLGADPEREYNAAHILVATEEEALALVAELEGGADFAELARVHSQDPGSAQAGGMLGWFGLGRMVAPFEAAVVALEPGQTSAPVETQFGWHIVRLNDSRVAEAPTFDEVSGELSAELQRQAVQDHIAAARAGATVEIMAEGIDPAVIRDQTLLDD